MLTRFPPELLITILDVVDQDNEYTRKSTLFACCTVSKAVRDVAQPILWRKIESLGPEKVGALLSAAAIDDSLPRYTRELSTYRVTGVTMTAVLRLFGGSLNLMKASFHHEYPMREGAITALCALPALSDLAMEDVPIDQQFLSFFTALPSLTSLTLDACYTNEESLATLLSTDKTPNLRVLRFKRMLHSRTRGWFTPPLSAELLARVERIYLPTANLKSTSPILPPSDKVLYHLNNGPRDAELLLRLKPSHLSLILYGDESAEAVEHLFPLFDPPHSLKSIALDVRASEFTEPVVRAYEQLVRLSEAQGVIIWKVQEDAFEEFGRYLRWKEGQTAGRSRR